MRRNIVSYARDKNDELKEKNWFGQKAFRVAKLTQEAILELPKFKRVNFSLDWGALAAARVINIAKTGCDGEFLRPFDQGKPSEKEMKKTVEVPGAFAPIENKFHASQALSWIAKERSSLQDQVQKLYDIPALISRLKDN